MKSEEATLAARLFHKSDVYAFQSKLQTRYAMSLAESECLTKDILDSMAKDQSLLDGQEFFSAISMDEPPGKLLKLCKVVRIKLTVRTQDDLRVRSEEGISGYFRIAVSRLCWEAVEQKALLTQEDLAFLLNLSRSQIKRIMRTYKSKGEYIPTRGNYHDIGPGVSHKYEAVKLYIKGYEPSVIARRMAHSLGAVERYINDFSLVIASSQDDYSSIAISRFTSLSEKLVKEYLILYDRLSLDETLKPFLNKLIDEFRRRGLPKKSNLQGGISWEEPMIK